MIKITCDKCGQQSDNPNVFGNKKYFYVSGDFLYTAHLCFGCQQALQNCLDDAAAMFFSVDALTKIEEVGIKL